MATRIIARLLGGLVIAALASVSAADAVACSGTRLLDDDWSEEFSRARVVFTGTAIRREEPLRIGNVTSTMDPIHWTFAVDAVEKGGGGDRITVSSARSSASCGVEFSLGQRYRVYASASGLIGLEVFMGNVEELDALAIEPRVEGTGTTFPTWFGAAAAVLVGTLLVIGLWVLWPGRRGVGNGS
jgi:hypothetical protein